MTKPFAPFPRSAGRTGTALRGLVALACCAVLAAAGATTTAGPGAAGREWVRIRIEGPLETGMLVYLERARDEARERQAGLLVELNTPGGEVGLMWRLATALADTRDEGIRTAAWVDDQALSAGALLALSCERLYMRSRSTIGSSLLVRTGPGGLMPVADDPDVKEKLTSNMRSEFAVMAEQNGRPAVLAEAMVDPKIRVYRVKVGEELRLYSGKQWDDALMRGDPVTLVELLIAEGELFNCTGSEAVGLGLADGLAESQDEVLEKLDGSELIPLERLPSEHLMGLLYHLWPVFLFLGLVFAYVEIKVPGFGVPGVLSIVCFGVMLFGRYLVGLADVPHIVLVVGGLLLVAVELFVLPGSLWPGLLGGLAVLAGIVWSLGGGVRVFDSNFGRSLLLDDALRVVAAAAVAGGAAWGLSQLLPRTSFYRRFVPDASERASGAAVPRARGEHARHARVDALGRALTTLRPAGKVVLDGAPELQYGARSDGPEIPAGARLRVVEVQRSGRLLVRSVEPSGTGEEA